jgi:hypothetical protein
MKLAGTIALALLACALTVASLEISRAEFPSDVSLWQWMAVVLPAHWSINAWAAVGERMGRFPYRLRLPWERK